MTVHIKDLPRAIDRYLAGGSLHEVADEFGVNYNTLRRRLIAAGVTLRPPHKTLHPSSHMAGRTGSSHPSWQGDEADNYNNRHQRVEAARGRATGPCTNCLTLETDSRFEWAQIHGTSGKNPDDYQVMCRHCHEEYDADKVSTEQVQEIKALSYFGVSQARLAGMYDVDKSYINHIVRGRRRKHVPYCEMG